MRSGRLRHRLILQSKAETRDSYGAALISWDTQGTVWGAIEPLTGKEYFSQQAVQAEAQVRIVIRYYSGIDTTWRVSNGGLYYDIVDVLNHDMRNQQLTLMCRQGVSETGADTPTGGLLLEDGFYLLLETGDKLLLES